jgi:hypothetical protein
MAESKKSFVLYSDLLQSIEHLTKEEAGTLFIHLLEYVNDKNPVLEDRLVLTAWKPIELQLKRDLEKFEEVKTLRSKAGKRSAELRSLNKPQQSPTKPTSVESVQQSPTNPTDTVNDTVNDTVTVNVTDTVTDIKDLAKAKSTNTNTLKEKKKKENFDFLNSLISEGVKELTAKDYLTVRKTKKAANTETAFNILKSEAAQSGLPFQEIIKTCVAQNWIGFKLAWYKNLNNSNNSKQSQDDYLNKTGQDIDAILASKFASAN